MKKKERKLYIKILLWAYKKQQDGFTLSELKEHLNLDDDSWAWVNKLFVTSNHNDRKLVEAYQHNEDGMLNRYTLNDKGMVAAIDYIELKEARVSSRRALRFAGISALISVGALSVGIWTGLLTRTAIELSADPIISITLDRSQIPNEADEVTVAMGLIPTENLKLKLNLINSSLPTIEGVDIRMTLWKLYVDTNNRHLTICPLGYVDHDNNPEFVVSNLRSDNIFNKTFQLKKGERYPFTVDFSNLKNIKLDPLGSRILLRVGVDYTKSVSQTNHNYMKMYALGLHDGYTVDITTAPDLVLSLNDKKNEKEIDGFTFPSVVHPFREREFIKFFEGPIRKLNLLPSACEEFSLFKKDKIITY